MLLRIFNYLLFFFYLAFFIIFVDTIESASFILFILIWALRVVIVDFSLFFLFYVFIICESYTDNFLSSINVSHYIFYFFFTLNFTYIILFLLTLIPILISVAYLILAERKVLASCQRRRGPNVVGFVGVLQPFIDAIKLLSKEIAVPIKTNKLLFFLGPILTLTISLVSWAFIPFNYDNFYVNSEYSLLYFLSFSSISVYGLLISGWASNSKYSLLGSLRVVAQFISYEISFGLLLLPVILLSQSFNFIEIVRVQNATIWFIIPLWPVAFLFFISMLAETNRTPFDLAEAEAELVAGYNTEYSSIFFIMFMFAEYSSVLLMSSVFVILFLGGWSCFFLDKILCGEIIMAVKVVFTCLIFILLRASLPRFRFDQVINFFWQKVLPLSISFLFFLIGLVILFTSESFLLCLNEFLYRWLIIILI